MTTAKIKEFNSQQEAEPVAADVEREELMDKSLRERALAQLIEVCGAWSDVKDGGEINEAKCQYASAQEGYLRNLINELADLPNTAPQPPIDLSKAKKLVKASAEEHDGAHYIRIVSWDEYHGEQLLHTDFIPVNSMKQANRLLALIAEQEVKDEGTNPPANPESQP